MTRMKTALGFGFWLLLASSLAFGQAALPAFYSGPWKVGPLPTGWTQNGLGSDYSSDYDASGGPAGKFDGSGDWVQIYLGGAPSAVSYYMQGNSLSGESEY